MYKKENGVKDFWVTKVPQSVQVCRKQPPRGMSDWRKFAVSIKGKPLRARSAEDVRGFLEDLECHDDTEPIRPFYSNTTVLPSRKDVPFKCRGKYK